MKKKRTRTAFSTDQIKNLEKRFVSNHYVVGAERQKLANELDLSEAQVKGGSKTSPLYNANLDGIRETSRQNQEIFNIFSSVQFTNSLCVVALGILSLF